MDHRFYFDPLTDNYEAKLEDGLEVIGFWLSSEIGRSRGRLQQCLTLLEQARASTDQAERARLYKEMQEIVQEDAPWVFIANWKQNAVAGVGVQDFKLQPSFFLMLQKVSKS